MKVVVAIDSLKGCLTSLEAGEAISEGIHRVYKDAEVCVRPIADGGEGTVEALSLGMGGRLENIKVMGPLGDSVDAVYGIIDDSHMAIIEMAAAAGITLIAEDERNPLYTTTYGVGEIIKDAVLKGCRNFIIGIGGSATNDGGIGMLMALGYEFLDENGNSVAKGAIGLKDIAVISDENALPQLKECSFKVACDVTNPLCGVNGCSAIFGPQKGATPEMVALMDEWLLHYAEKTSSKYDFADRNIPGTGAAGGLGYAFLSYLDAELESGIKIVLEETKLADYVADADIVVTGEGRLDAQSVMGKAPVGVASIAKRFGKKVIAFSGVVSEDAGVCNDKGIDAFFPIMRRVVTLEEAMNPQIAAANMADSVEQVFRLIQLS